MHILVTGGAGFIGSHLVERLVKDGHRVTIIDNFDPFYDRFRKELHLREVSSLPQVRFIKQDLNDVAELTGYDAVFHLAACAYVRSTAYEKHCMDNTVTTVRLMDAMLAGGVNNLILASTSAIYGDDPFSPSKEGMSEDRPLSPYAASKKAAELFTHVVHKNTGMNVVNLRFFTAVGARQRPDMALALFHRALRLREPLYLYGNGALVRDFTHVLDIVDGMVQALEFLTTQDEPTYQTFNLGSGQNRTVGGMVDALRDLIPGPADCIRLPKPAGDITALRADISKARDVLGYSPIRSLEDAVEDYVRWFDTYHIYLD